MFFFVLVKGLILSLLLKRISVHVTRYCLPELYSYMKQAMSKGYMVCEDIYLPIPSLYG